MPVINAYKNNKYFSSIVTIAIVVIVVILVLVLLFLLFRISSKRDIKKVNNESMLERFFNDDIPITTYNYVANAPTAANRDTTCKQTTDLISVCSNYENCCKPSSGSGSQTSGCFCDHPFVTNCQQSYQSCIAASAGASGGASDKCQDILDKCCGGYSSIDILSTNFQPPINATQSGNQICTVNGLANQAQRCMELCQTNPNCRAYSLVTGGCTLYDKVNYMNGKDIDKGVYVIKK